MRRSVRIAAIHGEGLCIIGRTNMYERVSMLWTTRGRRSTRPPGRRGRGHQRGDPLGPSGGRWLFTLHHRRGQRGALPARERRTSMACDSHTETLKQGTQDKHCHSERRGTDTERTEGQDRRRSNDGSCASEHVTAAKYVWGGGQRQGARDTQEHSTYPIE